MTAHEALLSSLLETRVLWWRRDTGTVILRSEFWRILCRPSNLYNMYCLTPDAWSPLNPQLIYRGCCCALWINMRGVPFRALCLSADRCIRQQWPAAPDMFIFWKRGAAVFLQSPPSCSYGEISSHWELSCLCLPTSISTGPAGCEVHSVCYRKQNSFPLNPKSGEIMKVTICGSQFP